MATYEAPVTAYIGYEEITVTTTPRGLNPPVSPQTAVTAATAFIQCQRATARVRFSGGDPTNNSGFMLAAGDTLIVYGPDQVRNMRFVADTNTQPLLSVHYYD